MSISWQEKEKLLSGETASKDDGIFGSALAIYKNYAVVGNYSYPGTGLTSSRKGKIYIYKKNEEDEDWTKVNDFNKTKNQGRFGTAVAISDDFIFIGSTVTVKKVFVYKKQQDGTWSYLSTISLSANDAQYDTNFGQSISVDKNYVIIGANTHAWIYKKNDSDDNWTQKDRIQSSDHSAGDAFGGSVAISGNYAIIGAYGYEDDVNVDSESGKAYIFKKDDNAETWSQKATLRAGNIEGGARFGLRVDIQKDIAVVSAYRETIGTNSKAGSVYVFKKNRGLETWSQQTKLTASDNQTDDEFGRSVAISNNYIIVGCEKNDDGNNTDRGSAYVFKKNKQNWTHLTTIYPNDNTTGTEHFFGAAVDIYNNYIIVGRKKESSTDKNGSAYIFKLNGDNNDPEEIRKLKLEAASNELKNKFNIQSSIIDKMNSVSITSGEATIDPDIKKSITRNFNGSKASKKDIKLKQTEFLKILLNNNSDEAKIKINSDDIGLKETISDLLVNLDVKEKVVVFKKNEETPIDISTEVSSDTGIYAQLDSIDDNIILDVGVAEKYVTVSKIQDASSNGDVDKWSVNYDNVDYEKVEGQKITINGITVYIGSVYIDGGNSGIPTDGSILDLTSVKIPYEADDNPVITKYSSNSKILTDRHQALNEIWDSNPGYNMFSTESTHLGLDRTIGKPIKNTVKVHKSGLSIDLTNSSNINKNQGVYGDLTNENDFIKFTTNNSTFRVQVTLVNPKCYRFKNENGTQDLYDIEYKDGHWATHDGVTFYFGGVYTGGTNDGITAADPYVFPIKGNPYKLPDKAAKYCLYADKNTFITGVVDSLSKEKQEEMCQWVIERIGSAHNNGAKLVTNGFFYSAIHVNTSQGEMYLDMETKVCNSNNKDMFTVKFKNSRDNTELFKGEHKTTATISWKDDKSLMAIDIDFFENPQIRNGIRMNTVITESTPIGLLVEDYEPKLLEVKSYKNKLSMYNDLLNKLELGERVNDEKLNLQKEGELWTRHNK